MPNPFAKAIHGVQGFLAGAVSFAEERQGAVPIPNPRGSGGLSDGDRARDRAFGLPPQYIRQLAESDDVIVAIRRTIRMAFGDYEWECVPDTGRQKADLMAWQKFTELNLAMPGLDLTFKPQVITPKFFVDAQGALRDLLRDEHEEDEENGGDGSLENNAKIRQFFDNCLMVHNAIAERHAEKVRAFFERPEPDDPSVTFRSFLDQVVDGLTLWDAAPLVKNPSADGHSLYELYQLPGNEINLYRRADRKRPMPPHVAFEWSVNQQVRAYYNAMELAYITANAQPDGYGKPPVESLFNQIMASLYGDAYMLDFFANNNAPRGVFDLGPGVGQGERDAMENRWNELVRKGMRRILFVSNSENVKGFIPMPEASNRDSEVMAAFEMWAKRKCAVFGLNLGDIGFTEDLHRSVAEDQTQKSQARGIDSLARSVAGAFNAMIVKGDFWVRNNPDDPQDLSGFPRPVFPFNDVKFQFILDKNDDTKDEATSMVSLVQAGLLTINEGRKDAGKPPIPGGDIAVVGVGQQAIKVADLKHLPPPQPPQAPGGPPGGPPGAPGQPPQGAPPGAPPKPGLPPPGGKPQPALPAQAGGDVEKMAGIAKRLAALVDGKES
jgi:phage portal protein BeeE